jgi:hypothetical protein
MDIIIVLFSQYEFIIKGQDSKRIRMERRTIWGIEEEAKWSEERHTEEQVSERVVILPNPYKVQWPDRRKKRPKVPFKFLNMDKDYN